MRQRPGRHFITAASTHPILYHLYLHLTHPGDHAIVHYRLVLFVLEVAVPSRTELGAIKMLVQEKMCFGVKKWVPGPTIHLLELFLSRAYLDSSLNSIRC